MNFPNDVQNNPVQLTSRRLQDAQHRILKGVVEKLFITGSVYRAASAVSTARQNPRQYLSPIDANKTSLE